VVVILRAGFGRNGTQTKIELDDELAKATFSNNLQEQLSVVRETA